MNISQTVVWTSIYSDMQKKSAFSLKCQSFPRRNSHLFIYYFFSHSAFLNGKTSWNVTWSKHWLVQHPPVWAVWLLFECQCISGGQKSNLRWTFNSEIPLTMNTKREWDFITLETKKDLDQIWGFHHHAIFNRAKWWGSGAEDIWSI